MTVFSPRKSASRQPRKKKREAQAEAEENGLKNGRWIHSTREGYIEALDGEGILALAREANLILRFTVRPGSFIGEGSPLAEVFASQQEGKASESKGNGPPEEAEIDRRLNEAVITGIRRTPRQDVECAIEELVEVAVRALSPGINDPFTAINCIDRLGASLGRLARRKLPARRRCDEDGHLRIIAHRATFAGALDAAFNQIRQYGRASVAVVTRLLEALEHIGRFASRPEDRAALRLHAEMVSHLGDGFAEEHDKEAIRRRLERVEAVLAEE